MARMWHDCHRRAILPVATLLLSGLLAASPVMGQGLPGGLDDQRTAQNETAEPKTAEGGAAPAPLISAPDEPARVPAAVLGEKGGNEAGGVNNFAASDTSLPPMDSFTPPTLPVVVELFTSQGCSSCPPADAMLSQIAAEPGVLALSFHVDYWDYLGWKDSFGSPVFTERQEGYARASGERSVYTPQIIVDGKDTSVAPGPAQLMSLIDANRASPAMLSVRRENSADGQKIELMPLSDLGGPVSVLLVRYAPERQVEVQAGENAGKQVTYTNVVLGLRELTEWDGNAPLRLTVRADHQSTEDFPADTRHVLLVQKGLGAKDLPGPILAAITLD